MIEFNGKKILVLGLQKSGMAAIRLLKTLDVEIFVSDKNKTLVEGTEYIDYNQVIHSLDKIDIIVKSPGIKFDIDILKVARQKKILIISEIELAYQFIDKNKVIVGITGTNGKTTTTELITKILKDSHVEAVSAGNIGYSLSDAVLECGSADVYVVELSSFQLLDIIDFKPNVAIILNLDEAHLDYHNTYDNYVNAKMNIFKNMTQEDYLVYNVDDKLVRKKARKAKCFKYGFSLKDKDADSYVDDTHIIHNGRKIISKDEILLIGEHNLYNVLAAISVAKVFYIEDENIKNTVEHFENLPHRIQKVNTINEIVYYNDSKSTNVKSTLCALNSFTHPVSLIVGGYDRNQDFENILTHKNVKMIFAFGQTKERILQRSIVHNIKCFVCNDLIECVKLTQNVLNIGDTVLFSPASASWDQFKNYEHRGEAFIQYVNELKN